MMLQGKVAVVTGASSGIGYALSVALVAAGVKVYCLSRTQPAKPVEGVIYIAADLTREEDVVAAAGRVVEPVDILVNNAGAMKRGHFWEISGEDFDRVWAVNVKGMWLMFKHFKDKLVAGALTLQVNSKNSLRLKADTFVYSLAKLADLEVDKLVAKTRPDLDMRVAYLGPVDTPLEWTDYTAEQKAEKIKIAISPQEAAKLLLDLILSDSKLLVYKDDDFYALE